MKTAMALVISFFRYAFVTEIYNNNNNNNNRCRIQLRLAQCYDDNGDGKKAGQCVVVAHELANQLAKEDAERLAAETASTDDVTDQQQQQTQQVPENRELKALRRQIRDFGIYLSARSKDAECSKAASVSAAAWKSAGYYDEASAAVENLLQECKAGTITDVAKVETQLREALDSIVSKLQQPQSGSADDDDTTAEANDVDSASKDKDIQLTGQELDCVARIGLEAVRRDFFEIAERAMVLVEGIKQRPPTADVVLGFLKSLFVVRTFDKKYVPIHSKNVIRPVPPQLPKQNLRALALARRLDALKTMDRALLTCRRLGIPDLTQDGCVLVWNLGLPLLTPRLRKHTHRLFSSAVSVLDEMNSPLVELRARFHFEIAKFEVASDFLTKALEHVNDALELDYGQITADVIDTPEFDITDDLATKVAADKCRPLDHHLLEVKHKLTLRSSLYKQPDDPLAKALLFVEQAKGAKDPTFKSTVLHKAAHILGLSDDAVAAAAKASAQKEAKEQDGDDDNDDDDDENQDNADVTSTSTAAANGVEELKRTMLCSDILPLLWDLGEAKVPRRAAEYILKFTWHPEQFRNIVFVQTQTCLSLAEIAIADVQAFFVKLEEEHQLALQTAKDDSELLDLEILPHETMMGSSTGPAEVG